jgi:hypothetical protein
MKVNYCRAMKDEFSNSIAQINILIEEMRWGASPLINENTKYKLNNLLDISLSLMVMMMKKTVKHNRSRR